MKQTLFLLISSLTLWFAPRARAADPAFEALATRESAPQKPTSYRAWKLSLIPVVASQALDVASSYGMRELNPALADPNGRFGARSAAIKIGITTGVLGLEYLIVRKHPGAAKVLWKMNLASAGVTAGVAAHNFSLK